MGLYQICFQLDGHSVTLFSLGYLAKFPESFAQIIMDFGEVRIETDRTSITCFFLGQAVLSAQQTPQVDVGKDKARLKHYCPAVTRLRLRRILLIKGVTQAV